MPDEEVKPKVTTESVEAPKQGDRQFRKVAGEMVPMLSDGECDCGTCVSARNAEAEAAKGK